DRPSTLGPGATTQPGDLEARVGEAGVAAVVDGQLGDAARVRAHTIGFEAGVAPRQRRDTCPLDGTTNHGQRTSPLESHGQRTQEDTYPGYNPDWPGFISGAAGLRRFGSRAPIRAPSRAPGRGAWEQIAHIRANGDHPRYGRPVDPTRKSFARAGG